MKYKNIFRITSICLTTIFLELVSVFENKKVFNKNKVVFPIKDIYIDKPELYLIHKYEREINNANFLDIGVGFGRTTSYFAKLAKEYVGIDYQEIPVDYCKKKYKQLEKAKFFVCDARDMKIFDDNSYDIVLFSFNGIDYVSPSDRLLILKEMRRVCRPNGIIYFSSLNLQSIENIFSFKPSGNPITFINRLRKYMLIRIKNPNYVYIKKNILNIDYAVINWGQGFKLHCHYITPEKQIEQLVEFGFNDIKVISLMDGIEIKGKNELRYLNDSWIYYFCRPKK